MALLSQSDFARLLGVSRQAVSRAVQKGILDGALRIRGGKRLIVEKTAIRLWLENHDPSRGGKPNETGERGAQEGDRFAKVRLLREKFRAANAQLELEAREARYIKRDDVRDSCIKVARIIRDRILEIPARLGPILAAESDPAECLRIIDEENSRVLSNLSREIRIADIGD